MQPTVETGSSRRSPDVNVRHRSPGPTPPSRYRKSRGARPSLHWCKTCLQGPRAGLAGRRQTLPAAGHHWRSARHCHFIKARSVEVFSKRTVICCTSGGSIGPDISQLSPTLQSQWHHDKNAHFGSILIKPGTGRKVQWHCDQCPSGHPHEWESTVNNRSSGTGCPFCASRAVCQHNSLATKAPNVAAQFSHKNQSSPHDYLVSSRHKVTWNCEHGHEWDARISHRTRKFSSGCPTCSHAKSCMPRKQQPTLTDSQHPMMQLWNWELNAKAGLDPSKITCKSHKRGHWIWQQCPRGQPHRWQAPVKQVFAGSGCPCCAGRQACICNSLQMLYPDIAAEWDYTKNKGTPSDYPASSIAEVWWLSSKRGSFKARIAGRTYVHP